MHQLKYTMKKTTHNGIALLHDSMNFMYSKKCICRSNSRDKFVYKFMCDGQKTDTFKPSD
jgi:hypothetical protein